MKNTMIEYKEIKPTEISVKLDGKIVGKIKKESMGWRYFPKGQKIGGELFNSLSNCKKSLDS